MDNKKNKKLFRISFKIYLSIKYILNETINIIKYYFYKYIFKKNINLYSDNNKKNLFVSSVLSILYSILLSILIFIIFKVSISEKQSYGDYNISKLENISISEIDTEETQRKEIVERVSTTAIDEEISAQSSYKYSTYKFNVDRTITTVEKVHIFNSDNWNDFLKIIPENTELNVNSIVSPGGYMMYKIADGEYKDKFITANTNLVNIKKNNDKINLSNIKKPIAIKIIDNTILYSDQDLKATKSLVYKNVILNINGLGINKNNRLIYHITDGSFVLVDNSKVIETSRINLSEKEKEKDRDKDKTKKNNDLNIKNNSKNKNNKNKI